MEGWPNFKDGFSVDCFENRQFYDNDGFFFDDDDYVKRGVDDSDDEIRGIFDQVLMVLLRGLYSKNSIRPIPALLGDGRPVDLFKLFCLVRERGGFGSVSKEKLWGLTAEKSGMGFKVSAALKLIYFKYLDELDHWLNRISGISGNGSYECSGNLGLLSRKLKKRFRDYSNDRKDLVKTDEKIKLVDCYEIHEQIYMASTESFQFCGKEKEAKMRDNVGKITVDDDKNMCENDENERKSVLNLVKRDTDSRKRKHDMFAGMLSWMINVAKSPCDPSIGRIPEPSKWKGNESEELWSWVLLAREAMLRRRHVDSNFEQSSSQQKKLKMHPSIYEDPIAPDHQPIGGLRCSKRLPSSVKTPSCLCCKSCSASQSKLSRPLNPRLGNDPNYQELIKTNSPAIKPPDSWSHNDLPIDKHVSVGPHFQANIPDWSHVISLSDSKWLGTKIWPPENQNQDPSTSVDPPGKGRPESCHCCAPDSVGCIRFHIAEKRMKLKLELGSAFYRWKFDRMGEEVSLSWSVEEEKRFEQATRHESPSLGKLCFSNRGWKELVSYYFNVLIIRRRSYQNRVTPGNIDSDDDESEFGSLGGAFGHEAVSVSGLEFPGCNQNEQFFDFD
ncbi:hypothetical protein Nepgr_031592 [Nepenthes gracilis]|uniref:ARID domain-containing protein n=1 Tax=Nepenthes gracilis TaxID=150966 RepID=A0AAD3TIK6_NEPGR|nr:hypothetical protein Nepgr_031592 [Nepenthes gracilis]